MSEPKVGMNYGTYNTLREQNNSVSKVVYTDISKNGTETVFLEYWGDVENKNDKILVKGRKVV